MVAGQVLGDKMDGMIFCDGFLVYFFLHVINRKSPVLFQKLLQARGILEDDFGCVHIHISDPISIRQFANGRIDRVLHALEPR